MCIVSEFKTACDNARVFLKKTLRTSLHKAIQQQENFWSLEYHQ